MSSQKGNAVRSRSQKYQNRHAFKNNLHDTSQKTKFINSIDVANVCERCKNIIEWKIKYKKYKPLKAPTKCIKCEQKVVKRAYHMTCGPCAKEQEVCPKCGKKATIILEKPTRDEQIKLDAELQAMLKALPERKRRTFMRYIQTDKSKRKKVEKGNVSMDHTKKTTENEDFQEESDMSDEELLTREDIITKLRALGVTEEIDDDDDLNSDQFDSDANEGNSNLTE